jgi:hypothetical protein
LLADLSPKETEIVKVLKISQELLNLRESVKKGGSDLLLTFKRYEACIDALAKLKASPASEWSYHKKPTPNDVTGIWVQKTQFKNWDNTFGPILQSYPDMAKWLHNDPDKKSISEVLDRKEGSTL